MRFFDWLYRQELISPRGGIKTWCTLAGLSLFTALLITGCALLVVRLVMIVDQH